MGTSQARTCAADSHLALLSERSGISLRVLHEIISLARKHKISKVILFGSRARGDYRETSDIDLAAEGGAFAPFSLDVDDTTYTLLQYDIVNLKSAITPELRAAIENEGILLYEEKQNEEI